MQYRPSEVSPSTIPLPPLAPRASQQPSSGSQSGRPARSTSSKSSSHRSRAGCWTCRGRKVKCDEAHPRCGPCTRLNKVCDWDHRWNFSDATASTQNRYTNVSTQGNAVWDVSAQRAPTSASNSPSPQRDHLPFFADLNNDEDRERKAETRPPGTFNVIVNPESFSSVPEYCSSTESRSRRVSAHSIHSSLDSFTSDTSRVIPTEDPNTVLLSRFEDAAPTLPSFFASSSVDRRTSLPSALQHLNLSMPPPQLTPKRRQSSMTTADQHLVEHFESVIIPRVLPMLRHLHESNGIDPIVAESRNFSPLHHAICAVSLLSLHYKGQATWGDALERDMQATQLLQRSVTSDDDLNSDGVFYLHFLLLVYELCNPVNEDNLWSHHLLQILRIVRQRQSGGLNETHLNILGVALLVDTHASLAGTGNGDIVREHLQNPIATAEQLRITGITLRMPCSTYYEQEVDFLQTMTIFNLEALTTLSKCSSLALRLRREWNSSLDPRHTAQAQMSSIAHFKSEMYSVWANFHPTFLQRDSPMAAARLTPRLRHLFETAYLFFNVCAIYAHTSMYPGQMLMFPSARPEVERHCANVLSYASMIADERVHDRHFMVFATFLAGFATANTDYKIQAINNLRAVEGYGLGKNATRTRELLVVVCEEQRQRVLAGGRAEEVDWITTAKARGLQSLDWGL